jgi:hypothetical protein
MAVVRAAALLAASALALSACTGSTHLSPVEVVAGKSATGRHASATASFKFSDVTGKLSDLSVRVEATPAQRVKGGWVVSCNGQGPTRSAADFRGRTPLDIAASFTPQPPESCEFVAVATLARSGRVRVELRGRRPSS